MSNNIKELVDNGEVNVADIVQLEDYDNRFWWLKAIRTAIDTIKENDTMPNFRAMELKHFQSIYNYVQTHKAKILQFLKQTNSLTLDKLTEPTLPTPKNPTSKFDAIEQLFEKYHILLSTKIIEDLADLKYYTTPQGSSCAP